MSLSINNTPRPLPVTPRSAPVVKPVAAPVARPVVANEPKPGFLAGIKGWLMSSLHHLLVRHPGLNNFVGNFTGPYIKHMFNAPAKPGEPEGPPPLTATTVEQARKLMVEHFKPAEGKVVVAIAGGGNKTVHCFVVSGVSPDGKVQITQAIAQTNGKPEDYSGFGGFVRKQLDKFFGNSNEQMKGVVVEDWNEYAVRSKRNSIVVMELDADPAKVAETMAKLKDLVGKPYDRSMLADDPATKATTDAMYCTEVSAWFVNELRPGTVKPSLAAGGFPVYQVADHMLATDVHGGPLKVLFNGQNRLDIKNADPVPKDR